MKLWSIALLALVTLAAEALATEGRTVQAKNGVSAFKARLHATRREE